MASHWPEKYSNTPETPEERQEMDSLYKYSEFDHHPVDVDKAWNSLNSKLHKKPTADFSTFWKVAAILLLTAGIGFTVLQYTGDAPKPVLTEVTTKDQSGAYILPDGSIVTLAENSSLTYNKEDFITNRSLSFKGEAFFEVKKDDSPFTISTNRAEVRVLGTSFNLEAKENLNVFVETGLVAVQTSKETKNVAPGQIALAREAGDIAIKTNTNPNILSWKTGVFTFENAELTTVLAELERYYKIDLSANQELANCTVTVRFENRSLTEVVDVLSTILNAESQNNGNQVKFTGEGCK